MKRELWRDPAFRWIVLLGLVITVVYVTLVVSVWVHEGRGEPSRLSHGGTGGLQAFLLALTGLSIIYYLIETRRLRTTSQGQLESMEKAQWPLVFPGYSPQPIFPGQVGPVLWAKNVGGGPAVEVHLIGLTTSQPMARSQVSLISVLSNGGAPTTLIEWHNEARHPETEQDVGRMKLEIRCFEQTKRRKFIWKWEGNSDWPGFFELREFKTLLVE